MNNFGARRAPLHISLVKIAKQVMIAVTIIIDLLLASVNEYLVFIQFVSFGTSDAKRPPSRTLLLTTTAGGRYIPCGSTVNATCIKKAARGKRTTYSLPSLLLRRSPRASASATFAARRRAVSAAFAAAASAFAAFLAALAATSSS